jgi:dipeptidyl aminopeptidase/acylaminoacyl peptidase
LLVALLAMAPTAASAQDDEGFVILERALEDGVEQAYVKYPSGDLSVTGWLFVNPFSANDVEPCILFNHGGVGGVSEGTRAKCRWLAKQGYIVFAPSYRGEDDSEGTIEVAAGEVDDVLAALTLLRDHPGIVPGQFALMGTSHGALISMMAAARPQARDQVRAVVAAYGVMDIYAWYQHLLDNDFDVTDSLSVAVYGTGPSDKPEAFAARHALSLVADLSPAPILLVGGQKDAVVPAAQARTMYDALREAGRTQDELRVYSTGGHGFLFWDDPKQHTTEELEQAEKAWAHILDFLSRNLERIESGAG